MPSSQVICMLWGLLVFYMTTPCYTIESVCRATVSTSIYFKAKNGVFIANNLLASCP